MSRILRRPMFRGGPVDSRGTGITTNLGYNNGGRVGYNRGNLVAPLYSASPDYKSGAEIKRDAPGILGLKFDSPFLSMKTPANRVGGVKFDLGQSPSDFANALSEGSPYRDYLTSGEEEFETEVAESGDVKFKLDSEGNRIPIESDKGSLADIIEKQRIGNITMQDTQGELGDKGTVTGMEEVIETNILDERNKKIDDTTKVKEVSFSDSADGDVTTVDENDLNSLIDRYYKQLGGDEAARRYGEDVLGTVSASLLEGKGFRGALADAVKVKSDAPKIKQAAAMLGIKGEQAQDLYKIKLQNQSGQLQQAVEYIKAINPGMTDKEALATYQRRPRSLSETVGKYKKEDGVIMPSGITLAAGEWFLDDYKGELPTDGNIKEGDSAAGKGDGAYTDKSKGLIFVIKDEVVTDVSKFEN
jgi:hypothetical protein